MKLLSALSVLGCVGVAASALANEVFLLGEKQLPYYNSTTALNLPDCNTSNYNHWINQVKFRAVQGDADVARVSLTFFNGEIQEIYLNQYIYANNETRWLDLSGESRCIKQLRIIGGTSSNSRYNASVQVFGVSTQNPQPQPQPVNQTIMFACKGITNSGCFKSVSCPAGKRIVAARGACDLETAPNYGADGRAYYNYLRADTVPFGTVRVVKESDDLSDGICQVGDTQINWGSANVSIYGYRTSINVGCRERDASSGGDCVIAGDIVCAN